jgi:hypothetical protein
LAGEPVPAPHEGLQGAVDDDSCDGNGAPEICDIFNDEAKLVDATPELDIYQLTEASPEMTSDELQAAFDRIAQRRKNGKTEN